MVPFTIPMTRVIGSPAKDSRKGRIMGIAAATAASNKRSTSDCFAKEYNSSPWTAKSSLFAVTTGFPSARALTIRSLEGSIPPITSTTTSTSGLSITEFESSVNKEGSIGTSRDWETLRTATMTTSSFSPVRSAIASLCSSINLHKEAPTVPQPRRPMLTLSNSIPIQYLAKGSSQVLF